MIIIFLLFWATQNRSGSIASKDRIPQEKQNAPNASFSLSSAPSTTSKPQHASFASILPQYSTLHNYRSLV